MESPPRAWKIGAATAAVEAEAFAPFYSRPLPAEGVAAAHRMYAHVLQALLSLNATVDRRFSRDCLSPVGVVAAAVTASIQPPQRVA